MRILVTHDDGIHAAGLIAAEKIARALTDDVWIVAPETEQSGASHSLTLSMPLRLREIDKRLRFLSKRLDDVQIVNPKEQARRDRVFFGATVTIEDENGESTYRIVGVDEVDGAAGDISWKSPVGRALLGKTIGDTVTVRWHAGLREVTVSEIVYV